MLFGVGVVIDMEDQEVEKRIYNAIVELIESSSLESIGIFLLVLSGSFVTFALGVLLIASVFLGR